MRVRSRSERVAPLHLVKVREWMDSQPQADNMSRRRSKKAQSMWLSTQPRTMIPPLPSFDKQASEQAPSLFLLSQYAIHPHPASSHRRSAVDRPSKRRAGRRLATVLIPSLVVRSLPLARSASLLHYPLPSSLRIRRHQHRRLMKTHQS